MYNTWLVNRNVVDSHAARRGALYCKSRKNQSLIKS